MTAAEAQLDLFAEQAEAAPELPPGFLNSPSFREHGRATAYRAAQPPTAERGFKWGLFVWAAHAELVVGVADPDARGPRALEGSPLGTLDRAAAAALHRALGEWLAPA